MRAHDSLIALLAIAVAATAPAGPAWAQPLPGAGGTVAPAVLGPPHGPPPAAVLSAAPPVLAPHLPEGQNPPSVPGLAERPSEHRPADPLDWARSSGASMTGAPPGGGTGASKTFLDSLESLNDDLTMITLRKRRDKAAAADGGRDDNHGPPQPAGSSAPPQSESRSPAIEIPSLRVVGIDRFRGRILALLRTNSGVRSYAPGDPIDEHWIVKSISTDGTVKISGRNAGSDGKPVQLPGGHGPIGPPAGGPLTIVPSPSASPLQPSAVQAPQPRPAG